MERNGKDHLEQPRKSISYSRVLSLSREIHPGMPTWPNDPQVEFHFASELDTQGYFTRRFSMGEHSGTHINSPNSFYANGASIDQYPADSLVVEASVVDVAEQVEASPDYAMNLDDMSRWEGEHGLMPAGSVVLLHTGWQAKRFKVEEYTGSGGDGGLRFPGFGADVVRVLLNERDAAGLGIDTLGVEPGNDASFIVNRLALEQPRIALENLCNLDQLPATGVTLVIGVLRLQGGTGSPASVLAFLP